MKLSIMSDLHLEFGGLTPPKTDADVVILAGDIHLKEHGVDWARKHFSVPVIYILGNHDHYGSTLERAPRKLKEAAAGTNVHILQNDSITIDGVRFIGATLWTDYRITGNQPLAAFDAQLKMSDFKFIRNRNFSKIQPHEILAEHMTSKNFIAAELARPFDGKTVVVTHQAPSLDSIPARFREGMGHSSAAYASDLEHMMGGDAIALWVHGHTHDSIDYDKYGTRVICNPRGYAPDDFNPEFNPHLLVEV